MMRRRGVGLAVAALVFPATGTGAVEPRSVVLEPIVRIAGGAILACGIAIVTGIDGTLTASLRLEKAETEPVFALEATWRDERGKARSLSGIVIETGTETTAKLLPPARPSQDGVKATGPIPGLPGSELMRSLLVSGGTLTVVSPENGTTAIAIPGPAPQQVRASYLNCAGDLERPGG
jgi:hypothetical protein